MSRANFNSIEVLYNDVDKFRTGEDGIVYGYAAGYTGPLNSMSCDNPGAGGRVLPNAFKNLNPTNIVLT